MQNTITSITRKASELPTNVDQLTSPNAQVAHSCNELAASVLAVIKSSVSDSVQELSHEVQALSHEVARAGKNLNHLIKKGLKTSKATPHRSTNNDPVENKTHSAHGKPMKETKLLNGASTTEMDCNAINSVEENQTQQLELRSGTMESSKDASHGSEVQTISKSNELLTVLETQEVIGVSYENTESCTAVKSDQDEKAIGKSCTPLPITERASQSTSYSVSSAKISDAKKTGKCQTEKTSLATGQVQYMPDSPVHSLPPTTVALNGAVDSDDDESSLI